MILLGSAEINNSTSRSQPSAQQICSRILGGEREQEYIRNVLPNGGSQTSPCDRLRITGDGAPTSRGRQGGNN
jgi:hypothetical protein